MAQTIINRPTGGNIQFRENNVTQMTIAASGLTTVKGALVVLDTSFAAMSRFCWNSSLQDFAVLIQLAL
jgi:hypothetical protein